MATYKKKISRVSQKTEATNVSLSISKIKDANDDVRKLEELREMNRRLDDKNRSLSKMNTQLKKALDVQECIKKNQRDQVFKMTDEIREFQKKFASQEKEIADLRKEIKVNQDRLERDANRKKADNEKYKEEKNMFQQNVEYLEKQLADMKVTLTEQGRKFDERLDERLDEQRQQFDKKLDERLDEQRHEQRQELYEALKLFKGGREAFTPAVNHLDWKPPTGKAHETHDKSIGESLSPLTARSKIKPTSKMTKKGKLPPIDEMKYPNSAK